MSLAGAMADMTFNDALLEAPTTPLMSSVAGDLRYLVAAHYDPDLDLGSLNTATFPSNQLAVLTLAALYSEWKHSPSTLALHLETIRSIFISDDDIIERRKGDGNRVVAPPAAVDCDAIDSQYARHLDYAAHNAITLPGLLEILETKLPRRYAQVRRQAMTNLT